MNRVVIALATAACSVALEGKPKNVGDSEEGGIVQVGGKGFAALIDCRDERPSVSECRGAFDAIGSLMQIDLRLSTGSRFAFETASEQLKRSGANVAVFIVSDPKLPMTLSAPEAKWSLINFAAVSADRPDTNRLSRRMSLLLIRQLFRSLGSDVTKTPDNSAYSVYSLADLDRIESTDFALNPYISAMENLERLGMEKVERVPYRDACEMGLAPLPTNDVQRAIWEEVHAPPTKPIKITYDKAAQKPVVK